MKNHEAVYIKLHKEHDKDIIERLGELRNKQGYIKSLIRSDIIYKPMNRG